LFFVVRSGAFGFGVGVGTILGRVVLSVDDFALGEAVLVSVFDFVTGCRAACFGAGQGVGKGDGLPVLL